MRSLKGAVKLTVLLHEPCSPDLASIHTGGDSVASSQPKESMWPVIQMMLSRKLPNSVTASHERTKHMFSRFGNAPIETMFRYLNVLVGSSTRALQVNKLSQWPFPSPQMQNSTGRVCARKRNLLTFIIACLMRSRYKVTRIRPQSSSSTVGLLYKTIK